MAGLSRKRCVAPETKIITRTYGEIEIQSKVDEINKSIVLLMEQITKYKEYKTTLINSAVTGKIKVV